MSLFKKIFSRKKKADPRKTYAAQRSAYKAAVLHRLTNTWTRSNLSADAAVYKDLSILRARSRDLAINNDYGRRFLNLVKQNVVGPDGIMLQVRSRFASGKLDKTGNDIIEAAWREWGKKGNCTVDGLLSWHDVEKLAMETVPKDGELLIRMIPGWPDNKFRFALQLIEADHIDEELNKSLPNGNKIRMGVEFDRWRRPVAYYVLTDHPHDFFYGQGYNRKKYERIPADQVLHPYVIERIGQSRGIPWMATPAERLHQLSAFEDAELVASRTGASKMGFFTSPSGDDYTGQGAQDGTGEPKELINVAAPGTFEELPEGVDFKAWDPDHPNSGFEQFVMAVLRGVASGLNISYVSLANDLRGVSYSSIRQGVLEDRDAWRMLQTFLRQSLHEPVYDPWLKTSLLAGAITSKKGVPMSFDSYAKFAGAALWTPRGWEWVDPAKEVAASILERQHGFNSSGRIMATRGRDFYEIIDEINQENEIFDFPQKEPEKNSEEDNDNAKKQND
jgi:lambda family phage portal protein